MTDIPDWRALDGEYTPGRKTPAEHERYRRESSIWLLLASVGIIAELSFGFVDGMHFAPGRVLGSSIVTIAVSIALMAMIPFAVKVNFELGLPGGPLIIANLNGDEPPYRWSEVLRDGAVWTIFLAIVLLVAITVLGTVRCVFQLPVGEPHHAHRAPIVMPAMGWFLFSASTRAIGAGVSEEILCRFALMSVFSWVLVYFHGNVDRRPTRNQLWLATILQGYCFGLMHLLPGSVLAAGIGVSGYAARAIVLPQTCSGIVFGRLYLKRGLEAAIAAHIIWDLMFGLGLPFLAMVAGHGGVAARR
jgi:membrane protease YdiL (CAAX protease family)